MKERETVLYLHYIAVEENDATWLFSTFLGDQFSVGEMTGFPWKLGANGYSLYGEMLKWTVRPRRKSQNKVITITPNY